MRPDGGVWCDGRVEAAAVEAAEEEAVASAAETAAVADEDAAETAAAAGADEGWTSSWRLAVDTVRSEIHHTASAWVQGKTEMSYSIQPSSAVTVNRPSFLLSLDKNDYFGNCNYD